ncbi:MAG: cadherin-like domain-containing protein [Rhodoferax sp.]|uniref:cadherin-like domain-containing protein n=1 Tax=Rhodoferax sp. TaxID=50421 RepID=UPI0026071472|nr:cadherin-like domain-containing protein [Rhodoferax sp.]MDD2882649.1 cadherin-like domain-containing protein [Rhodoferax sp.]
MSSTDTAISQLAIHQLNAVYFVNSDLADLATMLAGVPQGAEVVLLDPTQDGLSQMLTALDGRSGLDAIHLIGHGASGLIDLGSTSVTTQTLTERAADIATLGRALTATGDILLYGCNVGEGVQGAAFIQQLATLSGADVAASTNLTGAANKGGDWVLEAQTGAIEATAIAVANYSGTLAWYAPFTTPFFGNLIYPAGYYVIADWEGGTPGIAGLDSTSNVVGYSVVSYNADAEQIQWLIPYYTGHAGESWSITQYDTEIGWTTWSGTYYNYPPVANASGASGNEDTTITGTLSATDADNNISYAVTTPSANGTASITNTATGAFSFTPNANFYGTTTFTFTVTDSYANSTNTATITVNAVADAPTFTAGATLAAVNEGATAPAGATVTALLSAKFSDVDSNTFAGIAITADASISADGVWQYSTDTGTTWFAIGTVSTTTALLLSSAVTSMLRFVPTDTNWNGTPGGLSVLAIDNSGTAYTYTSGTTRSTYTTADYSATGSVAQTAVTLGTTVTAVNDAPVLQNAGTSAPVLVTIDENATANTGNLISTLVRAVDETNPTDNLRSVITDVDFVTQGITGGNPNEAWDGGVAIYGLTNDGPADGGKWQYKTGGGNWTDVGLVSASSALLLSSADSIRFLPDTLNGTTATFSYYVWDGSSGGAGSKVDVSTRGGTSAFSSAGDVASITVTHVNDNPTLDLDGNDSTAAGTSFTTTFRPRGEAVAVVDTDITIADVDKLATGPDYISGTTVSITHGAVDNLFGSTFETLSFKSGGALGTDVTTYAGSQGAITIAGNGTPSLTLTGKGTWADYQSAIKSVYYINANPNAATGDRTVTVTVTDGALTVGEASGARLASTPATATVQTPWTTVADLNGSATGRDHTATFTEDTPGVAVAVSTASLDNQAVNIKTVTLALSPVPDGSAEKLFIGTDLVTFLTNRGITVQSNDSHTVTLVATNSVGGYSGSTYGAVNSGVSAENMQLGLRAVQYVNSSQNPNVANREVNVSVVDINNSGVGAKTTINIVPVNDAPVIPGGGTPDLAATVLEGGLVTLTTTDINATDVDDTQSTLNFVVTTAPTKGVLFRDGNGNGLIDTGETLAAVAATGVMTSFTQADIAAGLVKYQQTDTAAGSVTDYASDSFAFKVQDGMENGVTAPTGTLALTITAVNDAPTLSATGLSPTFVEFPGTSVKLFSASAVSAVESTQTIKQLVLTVSGLADGAAEMLVVDGGAAFALQAIGTTAVTGGMLTGVSYSITLSGSTVTITLTHAGMTAAQAQTLIDNLAYSNTSTAPTSTDRVAMLVSVQDSGGTSTGVDTTALNITSTIHVTGNDTPPVLATNTGATLINGALTVLSTAQLSATDSDTSPASAIVYTVGTAATKGTLFLDANGSGTIEGSEALSAGRTFTQADVAAGKIKYRHDGADNNPDSFTFTVKDATTTLTAATFNLSITAAGTTTPGATGGGSSGANSTDGSDPLFSGVVVTPGPGNTIKSMGFTLTGVADSNKEILTLNGQAIPMEAGTMTVGDITYTVVNNSGGSFSITVTDTTNLGWNSADASAIVNGARYTNTQVPATAGVRGASLGEVTDWLADGTTGPTTPVAISTVVTLASSTDLWTLTEAQAAVHAPTTPNDLITTLNFTVTGVKNGSNEFIKINGHEVPMAVGITTVSGVNYTVAESPASSGNFTLAVTNPAGWTEVQSEALLDAATYSNNSNPATAGNRVVSLVSVVEAQTPGGGGTPIPSTTPTPITTPTLTHDVPTDTGPVTYAPVPASTPLSPATLPVTSGSTVDALTFTVSGVKDGAHESLTVDGKVIPLVATEAGTLYTGTSGVKFTVTVTVDAAGTATVLIDTPDAPNADAINYTQVQADTVVKDAIYNNSATPATGGPRNVTLTDVKEETGVGSPAGTTSHVAPSPAITGPVTVVGTPSIDVFTLPAANLPVAPTIANDDTIDSLTIGVSGVKDGVNEIVNINGQAIPLVAGVTTDAKGYTYTVTLDSNGNATLVLGTPALVPNFSQSEANAIIDGISYTNKSNPPTPGARDVTVNDVVKESAAEPHEQTTVPVPGVHSTVPVGTVTNTAPVVSTNAGLTVDEGNTFTLTATQLAATDVQQSAGSLVFKLVALPTHGTLFRDSNGNGLVDGTEAIALNGSFTQLELINGSIKYRHDSSETASDQLSFTVSDGTATTTAMPFVMRITPINDAPTLTATASNPAFAEGNSAKALFSAATASTGDTLGTAQTLSSLTIRVSNVSDGALEKLSINGTALGLSTATTTGNAGTLHSVNLGYSASVSGSTVTITLTHTGLTATEVQTLVTGLTYENTSTNPTMGVRSVSITQLVDSGSSTLPNLNTASLTVSSNVTVSAVNDTPSLQTGTGAQTQAMLEGGAFTLNTTHLAATDADSSSSSFSYKITSAQSAGLLYIDNNGNAVNDAGDTTLALNSTFLQADLTSGKVRYQHDGNEKDDSFQITVSDGYGSSSAATIAVTRTAVNDAPVLVGLDGDVLTYPPLSAAMLIDVGSNATVSDPDSTVFTGGVLRVSLFFNGDAVHDVLSIKNVGTASGEINLSGANVRLGTTVIGSYTGGTSAADLEVTLNSSADKAAVEALIHAIQFNNTDVAPAVNSRGIRITLSDDQGATSLASQVQVNIPVGGPSFLSGNGFYVSENTSLVTVMAASDTAPKLPIIFSVSTIVGGTNADSAKFTIDATTGTLSFVAAPDYETPTDSGVNNVYNVVVRASNKEGAYTESALAVNVVNIVNESGPAPGDTAGPVFGFATVNASTLTITYTDASNLDATNAPAGSTFSVQVAGSAVVVNSVVVNSTAKTATLTLASAITNGQAVTVAYNDPTANNDTLALQDAAGNDAATLTATTASNITAGINSGGGGTPTPTPTPTPTGGSSVTTDANGNTTVNNNGTGTTTVPNPSTGSTVNTTGSGDTTVNHPGATVTLNNTGTGTVTTSGIQGDTTLNVTGTGAQMVDLSGMKAGQVVTIDNLGSGTVNISNLPDGVIVRISGSGPVVMNDSDGSTQNVEDHAPALTGNKMGDGNGDGVADSLQSNVTSVSFLNTATAQTSPGNAAPVYMSLVADAKDGKIDTMDANTATLSNVKQLDAPVNLPAAIKMPLGLISFDAIVGLSGTLGAGITETFSLYVDPALGTNGYWKESAAGTWVNLASAVYGGQIVPEGGKTRLDFKLTDGGEFDADHTVNGTITDPGAAGFIPLSLVGYAPELAAGTYFWF